MGGAIKDKERKDKAIKVHVIRNNDVVSSDYEHSVTLCDNV